MGFSLESRNRRGRGRCPQADINVTPMVDVMLVLLIIFMVAAPMMTSGINVDLPKTAAKPVNADTAGGFTHVALLAQMPDTTSNPSSKTP